MDTAPNVATKHSIRLFQLHRQYWTVMAIEPLQPFEKNQQMTVLIRRLVVFTIFIVYGALSAAFLGYEAKTLNEYADSFYGFASMVAFSLIFVIIIWKMDNLFQLIGDFEKLIERRMENTQSRQTYVKLNENIEKWTGIFYFFMIKVDIPAAFIPHFIITFYLYFTTDLGADAFSLPFPIWIPFDWRTPIGYLIIFSFEYSVICIVCHFCVCYFATFTASCYVIFTFCNEIKNEIHALNESSKAGEKSAKLMKRLGDIVDFHSAAKQLVFDMDNIFASSTVINFIWSLLNICSTLLMIQIEIEKNINPLELIKPAFMAFWSFALLFLICEFGQMLTNHFDHLTDAIKGCDWTSFPKEIQKVLPIIIQNTQQEVVLETFKDASCSRESFKKVVNGGFSYFMVFRKFR